MRLCAGFRFCDNAADIFYKGEALCGGCANRKYGASIGALAAIQLRSRTGSSTPVRRLEATSSEVVPVHGGRPGRPASVGASEPPATLSVEELEEILALDTLSGPGLVEA